MAETPPDLLPRFDASTGSPDAEQPERILRHQASLFASKTDGLLTADVERRAVGEFLQLDFYVLAPALGDYSHHLLIVSHKLDPFPGLQIWIVGESEPSIVAASLDEYERGLSHVFGSLVVLQHIGTLMQLSREQHDEQ